MSLVKHFVYYISHLVMRNINLFSEYAAVSIKLVFIFLFDFYLPHNLNIVICIASS